MLDKVMTEKATEGQQNGWRLGGANISMSSANSGGKRLHGLTAAWALSTRLPPV